MSTLLSREQILGIQDLKQEVMEIPEWKGSIRIREATAIERDEYEESILGPRLVGERPELKTNFRNAKARLIVKCIINELGERIFSDKDAEILGQKSAAVVDRIFRRVRELSGMTPAAEKEMEKNLNGDRTESLPSG